MKINITSQQHNPLLKRQEVIFEIDHIETKGTPSRYEIRKQLAEKMQVSVDLLYVRKVETRTGTMLALGEANLYESLEQAKLVEPEHILARNVPPEEPSKEEKE